MWIRSSAHPGTAATPPTAQCPFDPQPLPQQPHRRTKIVGIGRGSPSATRERPPPGAGHSVCRHDTPGSNRQRSSKNEREHAGRRDTESAQRFGRAWAWREATRSLQGPRTDDACARGVCGASTCMGGKRRLQGDEGAPRHKSRSLSSTYAPGACPQATPPSSCAEREGGRKSERRREKKRTDLHV